MVLQKRFEYGFNGYQVPPTPRAPRSIRKRVSSCKKNEDQNRMCAFDLLATVAGELIEGDKLNQEESIKKEENVCNQVSHNKSFFLSEIVSKAPITDSGPNSGITVSDFSVKVPSAPRSSENVGCKIEDIHVNKKELTKETPTNGKPPPVSNLDSNNVNLVVRDDDEKFSCAQNNKNFGPTPSRIGDRRIRRLLASKQWKNDDVYRNKKSFYKHHQRSLRDYPFKKRKLYQFENLPNSNEDGSGLGPTPQDPAFQAQDSHVKLKIKSFRVPEFFIEIPETATVSSLKRTVMEAVTAIFSGDLHVGVMLQGKRIRDDNKTLLQTGICHDNKLDALGFTLEPNKFQENLSMVPPPGTPKSSTRYDNEVVIQRDAPMIKTMIESDHGSVVSNRSGADSRALAAVPVVNGGGMAVVPVRKLKNAEVAQRRIRRPFSVSEVEALVEAVEKLGTGRWRDVKLRAFDDAKHRTYVDLKDKWKTLVHTARISPQQRRGEPVPQELLDRVLTAHGYWSHHQAKNQFKHHHHQQQQQTQICRLL